MISIAQALAAYAEHIRPLAPEWLSLDKAAGLTLAQNLHSQLDLPGFTQSAMDGYALRAQDIASATAEQPVDLPCPGLSSAGDAPQALSANSCLRIYTGGSLPNGADSVEIQENVEKLDNGHVRFHKPVSPGANVRQQGEECQRGQTVLQAGQALDSQTLSLAAFAGHAQLLCHRRPRVSLITSGDELKAPGEALQAGQIHDSNSVFLSHFLREQACELHSHVRSRDVQTELEQHLHNALAHSDLVILSGGASVGGKDFSRAAAQACGIREVFWKVAQKPGKPLSFGLGPRGQVVMIVPGNPGSVFACSMVHLRAVIRQLQNRQNIDRVWGQLKQAVKADAQRDRLVRAKLTHTRSGLQFTELSGQASHMLANMANTQAILHIPAGQPRQAGESVQAWLC